MPFDDIQFPAVQSKNSIILKLKIVLGKIICWLVPGFADRVAAGKMPSRIGFVERFVIAFLVDKHVKSNTLDQLAPLHAWLWRGDQAVSFHEQAKARFDSFWLAHHSAIVVPIRELFEAETSIEGVGGPYHRLCEIGCGSGMILEDLARRLPQVKQLIGLDLSEHQTALNRKRPCDARIRFEAGDATAWVRALGEPGTVYLTVAGVFEYFPRQTLQDLFTHMAACQAPVAVALIEPIPADYDFEHEVASRPYGLENSLGHNYVRLLGDAGFTIRFRNIQAVEGQTFLLLLAVGPNQVPAPIVGGFGGLNPGPNTAKSPITATK